jgi:hypothetical protein
MATLAGLLAFLGTASIGMLIGVLATGELQAVARPIVYGPVLIPAMIIGIAVKRFIERRSETK